MLFKKSPEVLVVGAGPVGLLSALVLARRRIPVRIIDKAWRPASHSYGLGLHGSTLDILEEVGLLGRILERARRVDGLALYEGSELRQTLELRAGDRRAFVAVMSQDALEALLVEALKAQGVDVLWNHRIASLMQSDDHVDVVVDKLDKDSLGYAVERVDWVIARTHRWKVPFVLGADGYQSFVRRRLDIPFPEVGPTQHFAVFEFESGWADKNQIRLVLEPNRTNVMWPLPGARVRWSFELEDFHAKDTSRIKDRLLVQIAGDRYPVLDPAHLDGYLRERAPWFDGSVDDIDWRLVVRFEKRLAGSFGRGRLWLAGDAGHMTGPAGIQSMNVGLREGYTLAHAMADNLVGEAGPERLEAYGRERIAEWRSLLGLDGDVRTLENGDRWLTAYKERLPSCVPASGPILSSLLEQAGLHKR